MMRAEPPRPRCSGRRPTHRALNRTSHVSHLSTTTEVRCRHTVGLVVSLLLQCLAATGGSVRHNVKHEFGVLFDSHAGSPVECCTFCVGRNGSTQHHVDLWQFDLTVKSCWCLDSTKAGRGMPAQGFVSGNCSTLTPPEVYSACSEGLADASASDRHADELLVSTCLPCCEEPPKGMPCCCRPLGCPLPPSCPRSPVA